MTPDQSSPPGPTVSHRPEVVVFDVNETLTDLAPLHVVFNRFGLGNNVLAWWFSVLLRDGFALAATGDAAPFGELAAIALDEVAGVSGKVLPEGASADLIEAFGGVPIHPDVTPALDRLRVAEVPAYALTNGSAGLARTLLKSAGVLDAFVDVVSVDEVNHWKPRPEPYRSLAKVTLTAPGRVMMIASHPWDLHGAACVGLMTGWVNRSNRPFPSVFRKPTVQSTDLDGVVEQLLALGDD